MQRSLRILHVISSLNPKLGGPAEGLKRSSSVHKRQGHDVHVLTLDSPDAPWLSSPDFRIIALGPSYTGLCFVPGLIKWLKSNAAQYDAVIVRGLWQYHSYATWRALRNSDVPYYVFTHGMLDPWFKEQYPLKHAKKWLIWPWGQFPVLRDARAVLFTSEEERLAARKSFWLYKCNEQVVKYGTPGPDAYSESDVLSAREHLFHDYPQIRQKRCLLFLGRIHEKKGLDLVLQAVKEYVGHFDGQVTGSRAHLVVAGPAEGEYYGAMQRLAAELEIEDCITWVGMVAGPKKWAILSIADAFVLSSHQENFGIAVAEALACGTPVLISDRVNIWREVKMDDAGLVEPDTEQGTSKLLHAWLTASPQSWDQRRTRARLCFEKRFHIEAAASSLIDTLKVCGTRSRG